MHWVGGRSSIHAPPTQPGGGPSLGRNTRAQLATDGRRLPVAGSTFLREWSAARLTNRGRNPGEQIAAAGVRLSREGIMAKIDPTTDRAAAGVLAAFEAAQRDDLPRVDCYQAGV